MSGPHEGIYADVVQFEAQKFACLADAFFLFLCLSLNLSVHLRVVWRVVLNELCGFPRLVDVAVGFGVKTRGNMQTCLSKNLVLLSFFSF